MANDDYAVVVTECGCFQLIPLKPDLVIETEASPFLLSQGNYLFPVEQSLAIPNGIKESELPTVTPDGTTLATGLQIVDGELTNVMFPIPTGGNTAPTPQSVISDGTINLPVPFFDGYIPVSCSYNGSSINYDEFTYDTTVITLPNYNVPQAGKAVIVTYSNPVL